MRKVLSVFGLALLLVAVLVPASLAVADDGAGKVTVKAIDELAAFKPGTPVTIFFNDKGEIIGVKEGVLDGSKVEVLKESLPDGKTTGVHNRNFTLCTTNRYWDDYGHVAHYLNVGDRQATAGSWNPDANVACFVGVYNVDGGYGVGITNTSPNNVLFTASTAANYRPYVIYYGSLTVSSPSYWQVSYYPWYP
jgi:hypothetical protein